MDTSTRPAPDAGEKTSAPIRLWLVDDNDRLRETVAELLARLHGVECTRSFSSATAAVSALASKPGPDVILLDIQMGDENGLDAVRPIKSLSRATRVFMFTSLDDEMSRQRAREDGASGFLLKRYAIDHIVDALRKPGEYDGLPRLRRRQPAKPGGMTGARTQSCGRPAGRGNTRNHLAERHNIIQRCLGLFKGFLN